MLPMDRTQTCQSCSAAGQQTHAGSRRMREGERKESLLEILVHVTFARASGEPERRTNPKMKLWVSPPRLSTYRRGSTA